MTEAEKSDLAQRRTLRAAVLSLPAGIVIGGVAGALFGQARIGVALGAAFGMCAAIALLAALAISAATRN